MWTDIQLLRNPYSVLDVRLNCPFKLTVRLSVPVLSWLQDKSGPGLSLCSGSNLGVPVCFYPLVVEQDVFCTLVFLNTVTDPVSQSS